MKIIRILNNNLELYISMVLITVMTLLIFVQVIMRYVFQASLSWSEELARYIFIWLIYISISQGAQIMKHIKIEAALGLYPKKMRPFIVILGDLLFLMFAAFVAYVAWNSVVVRQMALGQVSPALGIPLWMVYAAPAVGLALTSIRQVQTILYRFKQLGKEE